MGTALVSRDGDSQRCGSVEITFREIFGGVGIFDLGQMRLELKRLAERHRVVPEPCIVPMTVPVGHPQILARSFYP